MIGWIVAAVAAFFVLGYLQAPILAWTVAGGALGAWLSVIAGWGMTTNGVLAIAFLLVAAVLNVRPLRRAVLSDRVLAIYRRIVPVGEGVPSAPMRAADAAEWIGKGQVTSTRLLAMDEIFLSVARDPGFQPFVPQLRYLRGRTSRISLQAMVGADRSVSPLDAALYSGFVSGQRRASIGRTADVAEARPA